MVIPSVLRAALLVLPLAACSTTPPPPPYVPPQPSQPSAQLTFIPESGYISRHSTEKFEHRKVQCGPAGQERNHYTPLAKWEYKREGNTPVQLAFPAGRNHFFYLTQTNGSMCSAWFSANLEAGHRYAVKMATHSKGFLRGKACILAMVDSDTGAPVNLETAAKLGRTMSTACARPRHDPERRRPPAASRKRLTNV